MRISVVFIQRACLHSIPVVGASTPSFAKWITAVVCYVAAAIQILGFIGVSRVGVPFRKSYSIRSSSHNVAGEANIVSKIPYPTWINHCRSICGGCGLDHFVWYAPFEGSDQMRTRLFQWWIWEHRNRGGNSLQHIFMDRFGNNGWLVGRPRNNAGRIDLQISFHPSNLSIVLHVFCRLQLQQGSGRGS